MAVVHVQAWHDAYDGLLPAAVIAGMTIERRTAMWERIIGSDDQRAWLAQGQQGVIGVASAAGAVDPKGWGQLYTIYVVRSAWGTGAGSRLWEAVQDGLTDMGFVQRQLYVLDTNNRARRFYEHKGWVHDGTVLMDETFGPPIREVRYLPRSAAADH